MTTITLERIHEDILEIKKEMTSLKECFHEDLLELSDETISDIEESRTEIKQGKFKTLKL